MLNGSITIEPYRAYTLEETANLLQMHPAALRRKLTDIKRNTDPFIQKSNPQKIGKEWRFMGENILHALGSIHFQHQPGAVQIKDSSGVASLDKTK